MSSATPNPGPSLQADFFDGRNAASWPVTVWLDGQQLQVAGDGIHLTSPASQAIWPEHQRHGQRQVLLDGGGVLSFGDAAAYDAWVTDNGRRQSLVVTLQQSWRMTAAALLMLLLCLAAAWRWGVPALAEQLVVLVPETVQAQIGQQSLAYLDEHWLKPSQIDSASQLALTRRFFNAAGAARLRTGEPPAYRLKFRDGGQSLGPNAFALPGGDIVVTDALIALLLDQPDAVVGVLAHELGHVRHRHGLRVAMQAGAVGLIAGLVVGDYSALLAAAPALLAQMDYSRDFEREADGFARQTLRGAGIDPKVMLTFFERVADWRRDNADHPLPMAISSHPADAERMAFFSAVVDRP